jgi:hydrogenase expression/formation protein HypE
VPQSDVDKALGVLACTVPSGAPTVIGSVRAVTGRDVLMRSVIGSDRVLHRLSGEQLPRIC